MRRFSIFAVAALFLGVAVPAVLQLPQPEGWLAQQVDSRIQASGVKHAVTAVLLNFRGYDTLLEIAVLLLALIGLLAGRGAGSAAARPAYAAPPLLQAIARLVAPLTVLVAGYLLWAGAQQAGGAFQAASVLAAGAVLLHLCGLLPAPPAPRLLLRLVLAAGFAAFLALAGATAWTGVMLAYPAQAAKPLILLLETMLTLSLGLLLACLYLWLPHETEEVRS